jgi:Lrp/AsnC family transcriptional regulator, leucine-responsive regulatory protein
MILDLKDKKILYELDKNSRQPNSEIARHVHLSKQVVGFRIQKLIADKIISFFYTVIDTSKLGFTLHKNFVRLRNITKEKEKEFIEYIKSNPNVVWAASSDGRYDFIFSTWAKDVESLDRILKEINNKFGTFIYERQVATILKGQYLPRDYLLDKKRASFGGASFGAVAKKVNLDKVDWQILLDLGKNARTSAVNISQKPEISADAVGDRLKKMRKLGVITGYTIVPNESKYPYMHYKILISLKNISEKIEQDIIDYCKANPNIVYIVKALGEWDFEVDVEVESIEKFRELMMNLKSRFQNDLRDYSSLLIYQVHKYNFCPSIPD